MRLDPPDVAVSAMAITPWRVLAAWLAGSVGAMASLEAVDLFSFLCVVGLYPFVVLIVSLSGGWWAFLSLPVLFALGYRSVVYVVQDRAKTDLLVIAILSFFACLPGSLEHDWLMIPVLLILGAAFVASLKEARKTAGSEMPGTGL